MLGLGLSFAQFLPNVTGWGAVIDRILVATDQSETATRAVAWAAEMSDRYAAQLLVLQVIPQIKSKKLKKNKVLKTRNKNKKISGIINIK